MVVGKVIVIISVQSSDCWRRDRWSDTKNDWNLKENARKERMQDQVEWNKMHCSELILRTWLNLSNNLFSGQWQNSWVVQMYRAHRWEPTAFPGNCWLLKVFIYDKLFSPCILCFWEVGSEAKFPSSGKKTSLAVFLFILYNLSSLY